MNKKTLLFSLIISLLFTVQVFAQTNVKVSGIASKGGKVVRISASTEYKLMETYPLCTVTVYLTGTLTTASIFSDEGGTAKSNPFTAGTDASYSFYIAPGRYDIKFSGTGIISPFTISDVFVETGGGGGGSGVDSFNGRTGVVVPVAGDYSYSGLDFTGSNFNSIATRSASDLNAGTLPDARFPGVLPAISGINLTNLNASNIASGTLADARLSNNVPLKDAANTFTNINLFTGTNVGIGTTGPDRKLDILDPSNAQLRLSAVDNSVYTDLYVDSGGNINILPTGNVTFDATGNQVNPLNNYDQNLGQVNKKYLSLWAAELNVETLVAQNTIATIGGRIIVAPTNTLIADLAPAATTINVKYNNFSNGDRVYMEANSSVEFFAITSGASVITGGFSYTVTRNLDGTGANQWYAGDAMVDTGVSGNGFIDLYSIHGVKAGTQLGPTIVGNVRNSSTFNDWTENWAIGNLNGIYGYGVDTYGVALGKYSAGTPHITVDSTNGIRIFDGLSTNIGQWDNSGTITIGQIAASKNNIQIGPNAVVLRSNVTERIRLNTDGSGFLANNSISWDTSGNLSVTANATIAGWAITSNRFSSGSGATTVGLDSTVTGGDDVRIFAGNATPSSAPFRVTESGVLTATSATITGNITATGGSITGVLNISGSGAAIALGTTPPTSASSGTGIWLDRTGLYGLLSSVVQTKIDATTGAISAGAGNTILNANGIRISEGTATEGNYIKWLASSSSIFELVGYRSTSPNQSTGQIVAKAVGADSTGLATVHLEAQNAAGGGSTIDVIAYSASHATLPDKGVIKLNPWNSGSVVIGWTDAVPIPSVALKVTDGAILPPVLTTTQRDALTPTEGMFIYNVTTHKHQGYNGTTWNDFY